jgi:hypothetical protein
MSSLIMLFFLVLVLFSLFWHDQTSERPPKQSSKHSNHGNDQ